MTESQKLLQSDRFRNARRELIQAIGEASSRIHGIRPAPAEPAARESYLQALQAFQKNRGRDLYFPFLGSGLGSGPFVELEDGSVKYDMITGIGINFFGHSHPELMAAQVDSLGSNVWQGNLEPHIEARELLAAILSRVGADKGCRLKHGWLTTCGTMANENALKIIRQKKAPATKVIAFNDCFLGRSQVMAEITDNPGYRQGLPNYGEVLYVPFYDPKLSLDANIERTTSRMKEHIGRYPDKIAALEIELIQGEGGFNFAPREWYVAVFELAKKSGIYVWADEIQTFGRTGEYFAYQTLGLEPYVDMVTVAKMLQASVFLYTEELNPKPGLVAGTFSGPSGGHRAAKRTLELLEEGKFLGKEGRIARLSQRFTQNFERMRGGAAKGLISDYRALGGMIAFAPFEGKMEQVKATLMRLYDLGLVAFYCGHGPYLIRMLPPLGAMTEAHVDEVCKLIETALADVAAKEKKA